MKPLYLYGPPASGKSTLATRLSDEFGVEKIDLDAEIVRRIGMPIARFFAERGEAAFREIESQTLREVDAPVVALGGGTLLRDENRQYAESRGFVAVLDVDEAEIARRIGLAEGTRPLGNKAAERRVHYASFAHHVKGDTRIILPCRLAGDVAVPLSKSHVHRILIADLLAGGDGFPDIPDFCEDIAATRRCIAALQAAQTSQTSQTSHPVLDCGESGSTLRFMAPIAAALGIEAEYVRRGRLASRPMLDYSTLRSGRHELAGNISSQFVTGLLFALPLLDGDSQIVFSSPLESRGYVDMTLDVVRSYGIRIDETPDGFSVPGGQKYARPESGLPAPEGDWSAAAFWFAANALGSDVRVTNLSPTSRQPDRAISTLDSQPSTLNSISQFPDLYPALAVMAAAKDGATTFVNAGRLRIKESDRIAAMESVLSAFGVEASSTPDSATVRGNGAKFRACEIDTFNDHRIAMAAAIAATRADGPVLIHGASCVAKSYPRFFDDFYRLTT